MGSRERHALDQPPLLQPQKRLADWRAVHAVGRGQRRLGDLRAGRQVTDQDPLPDGVVQALGRGNVHVFSQTISGHLGNSFPVNGFVPSQSLSVGCLEPQLLREILPTLAPAFSTNASTKASRGSTV